MPDSSTNKLGELRRYRDLARESLQEALDFKLSMDLCDLVFIRDDVKPGDRPRLDYYPGDIFSRKPSGV